MKINYYDIEAYHITYPDSEHGNKKKAWFSLPFTTYGDYTGSTVSKANQLVLIDALQENHIEFMIKYDMYSTKSLLISIKAFDTPYIQELIEDLEDYPVIDEDFFSTLEYDMAVEYLLSFDFKLDLDIDNHAETIWDDDQFNQDIMLAYHHMLSNGNGEGVIFETGCVPYLHKSKLAKMREYLLQEKGYQSDSWDTQRLEGNYEI